MTKVIDWAINHNKAFEGWTHYEKWEYREDVIEGIKEKFSMISGYMLIGAIYGIIILVGFGYL